MNKKASFGINLFGFFFALMIVMAILFFFLTALPVILHTYGMETVIEVNQGLVDSGVSSANSQTEVIALSESYKNLYLIADYVFMFFLISVFIESVIASVRASREGIFSFFGLITLGNVILIFILGFAVKISDWILNEIVYNILLVSFDVPFAMWFFEWNLYIGFIWFTILLVVNIFDLKNIGSRFGFVSRSNEEVVRFEE